MWEDKYFPKFNVSADRSNFRITRLFYALCRTQHNRITINDSFKLYTVHQNHSCEEKSYSIQAEVWESKGGTATLYWLYG
jgi:hypothetical protein